MNTLHWRYKIYYFTVSPYYLVKLRTR